AAAHERGMPVVAWTVDDTTRMAELVQDGADGIVTNRPDRALQLRDGATAQAA
ncbi:MAG: hypothetical protein KDC46_12900, partial [Thermoleophilia bacterium]|nr:hypothetical protein [Thermoleophilia bacterium]